MWWIVLSGFILIWGIKKGAGIFFIFVWFLDRVGILGIGLWYLRVGLGYRIRIGLGFRVVDWAWGNGISHGLRQIFGNKNYKDHKYNLWNYEDQICHFWKIYPRTNLVILIFFKVDFDKLSSNIYPHLKNASRHRLLTFLTFSYSRARFLLCFVRFS